MKRMDAALTRSLFALVLGLWPAAWAGAATIAGVQGAATVVHQGAQAPAAKGDELADGDQVATSPSGELLLSFDDGGHLVVRPGSELFFEEMRPDATTKRQRVTVRIARGGLRYVSGLVGPRKDVVFRSGTLTIGLRGTDIDLVLAPPTAAVEPGTYLRVNSGEAEMIAKDGSRLIVKPDEVGHSQESSQTTRSFVPRPPFVLLRTPPPAIFERGSFDALLR